MRKGQRVALQILRGHHSMDEADFRCPNGALSDYVGNLMLIFYARITDKNSGGNGSATVLDITFGHAVSCATTGDGVGSTCSSTTSFDALLGGASVITEGKRAIWDLDDAAKLSGNRRVDDDRGSHVPGWLDQGELRPPPCRR